MRVKRFGGLAIVVSATWLVLGSPVANGAQPGGRCTDASRRCVISAAGKYIEALVSHDGSKVPTAPNARRTENGLVTATTGEAIRNDLRTNQGDQAIYQSRDVRWFVDGTQAVAYYLLDTSAPGTSSPHTATVHLAERFKVVRGLIHEIEAIFWVTPGPAPASSQWPPGA